MRFKHPPIEVGHTRVRPVFALFPTTVGGEKVWMEWYVVKERFSEIDGPWEPTYEWKEIDKWMPKTGKK